MNKITGKKLDKDELDRIRETYFAPIRYNDGLTEEERASRSIAKKKNSANTAR